MCTCRSTIYGAKFNEDGRISPRSNGSIPLLEPLNNLRVQVSDGLAGLAVAV
jgi:hypothetical protein